MGISDLDEAESRCGCDPRQDPSIDIGKEARQKPGCQREDLKVGNGTRTMRHNAGPAPATRQQETLDSNGQELHKQPKEQPA